MRGSEGVLQGKEGSDKPAAAGRAGHVSFEYGPSMRLLERGINSGESVY